MKPTRIRQKSAKKKSLPSDSEIMRALIGQVAKAANGDSEQRVTTFITKPMWRAFLRATGSPVNAKPTEWQMGPKCMRVYGSKTIVVPSKKLQSISFSVKYDSP